MVKTTVYLDREVALKFRQLSESKKRSQAELIREALADYARRDSRPAIPGVGEFRSGLRDTSERAKEILTGAARRGKWRRGRSRGPLPGKIAPQRRARAVSGSNEEAPAPRGARR
jgi:predicted transcriptional regulator